MHEYLVKVGNSQKIDGKITTMPYKRGKKPQILGSDMTPYESYPAGAL